MSRYRTSFILNLSRDDALAVCVDAIDQMGWPLGEETEARITARERSQDISSTVSPVRIAVSLGGEVSGARGGEVSGARGGERGAAIEVTVNGANFGGEPMQVAHVRGQVERLVRAIEAAAAQAVHLRARRSEPRRRVVVNRVALSDERVAVLERHLGGPLADGDYWYDRVSGAWGAIGGPTLCSLRPSLTLGGPLRADSSWGATALFVNGRELDENDAAALRRLIDIPPGRYWIDAARDFGMEGGPRLGNLALAPRSLTMTLGRRMAQRPRGAGSRERARLRRFGGLLHQPS